jgi:hypothetical protein
MAMVVVMPVGVSRQKAAAIASPWVKLSKVFTSKFR